MIPSIVASEVRTSLQDFLRTTFHHSTHSFEKLMDNFLADPENCFKGPYVSVALPFRPGDSGPAMGIVPSGFANGPVIWTETS